MLLAADGDCLSHRGHALISIKEQQHVSSPFASPPLARQHMMTVAAEHLVADGLRVVTVAGGSSGAASCPREKVGTGSGAWATPLMMIAHPLPGGAQLGPDAHCSSSEPDPTDAPYRSVDLTELGPGQSPENSTHVYFKVRDAEMHKRAETCS